MPDTDKFQDAAYKALLGIQKARRLLRKRDYQLPENSAEDIQIDVERAKLNSLEAQINGHLLALEAGKLSFRAPSEETLQATADSVRALDDATLLLKSATAIMTAATETFKAWQESEAEIVTS